MKTIVTIIVALFVFQSCSVPNKMQKVPDYTNDSIKTQQMVTHQPIPMPGDTTKNIIVYNVVEQSDKKFKITDETIRLLIADFFGTITTVITVWQMQGQTNP